MPVATSLIGPNDPPVYERINTGAPSHALLVCDHASCRVPAALDDLGLPEDELRRHIGWDTGAAAVTRHMAELLNAQAILAGYSRLVIDCNRPEKAPDRIPEVADGTVIPGNQALDDDAKQARIEAFFTPYHGAVRAALDDLTARGPVPVLLAIHSFTPQLRGEAPRPWQVAICYDQDQRMSAPMIPSLRAEGFIVGDNEPYDFGPLTDYTVPEHAEARGLPHLLVEIRADGIAREEDCRAWAERLCRHIRPILEMPENQRIEFLPRKV